MSSPPSFNEDFTEFESFVDTTITEHCKSVYDLKLSLSRQVKSIISICEKHGIDFNDILLISSSVNGPQFDTVEQQQKYNRTPMGMSGLVQEAGKSMAIVDSVEHWEEKEGQLSVVTASELQKEDYTQSMVMSVTIPEGDKSVGNSSDECSEKRYSCFMQKMRQFNLSTRIEENYPMEANLFHWAKYYHSDADYLKLPIISILLHTLRLKILAIWILNSRRYFNEYCGLHLNFNLEVFELLDRCFTLKPVPQVRDLLESSFDVEQFENTFSASLKKTLDSTGKQRIADSQARDFFISTVEELFAPIYLSHGNTLACIGPISLPYRKSTKAKVTKDSYGDLLQSMNSKLEALASSKKNVDFSLLFVGIAQPDARFNKSRTIDFPVLLKLTCPGTNTLLTYQASGAIYVSLSEESTIYLVSILTRHVRKNDARYFIFERSLNSKGTWGVIDHFEVPEPAFPSSKNVLALGNRLFFLRGVVLFHNEATCVSGDLLVSKRVCADEMLNRGPFGGEVNPKQLIKLRSYTRSCQNGIKSWLDDRIINNVLGYFARFIGEEKNLVVSSLALANYLISNIEGEEAATQYSKYLTSKELWEYKNIFDFANGCGAVHIPVNWYNNHWLYVLILVHEKKIVVHDPQFNQERVQSLGAAIFEYVKLEADGKVESEKWEVKLSISQPQQKDDVNCGVFTILSAMRAMRFVKDGRKDNLLMSWTLKSSPESLVEYRSRFCRILLEDDLDRELQFFSDLF